VRDAATQQVQATMTTTPANIWVAQPDLSPDGTQLVYVRHYAPVSPRNEIDFSHGSIYVRSYDPGTRSFGPERVLVSDTNNNFYPSWSPDGTWIAFNRSDGNFPSFDDNTSAVWVVKADGSQPPIQLASANQGTLLTNSGVRWAPFAQTLAGTREPMFWLTMSSKRNFGVRWSNDGRPQRGTTGKRAQQWMTPFFPARAALGRDPSAPAFRLPFQNLDTSNLTAQWTERIVVIE